MPVGEPAFHTGDITRVRDLQRGLDKQVYGYSRFLIRLKKAMANNDRTTSTKAKPPIAH